ncbi:MAG TPA: DUF1015 domain-containing protein [Anaeromyxobacter sp.]|nr:DUF1015 domain-containing protein [Anaeromyxobacter sp.]
MAEIAPFRGVRFAARAGRALADLLAPPYDLVTPEERAELLRTSPYNIAHLSTGEGDPAAGPGLRFEETARRWARWLEAGVLMRDPAPALYPVEQAFSAPDGRQVRRRGFLAALRLHDLAEGIVIPHERTQARAQPERLELLRATRVNFSALLGLYADERWQVEAALGEATAGTPEVQTESEVGGQLRVWRADRPEVMARLAALVEDQRVLLADGHHRYQVALEYRRRVEAEDRSVSATGGHNYVLTLLCSLDDPGLVVYPVHRLVSAPGGPGLGALLEGLRPFFAIEPLSEDIHRPAGRAWAIARLAEHAGRSTAFLMLSAEDGRARVLTLRDDADLDAAGVPPGETARMIDLNVLHALVLKHLLGIDAGTSAGESQLAFVRDAQEAVTRVLSGEHRLGFLVNPPPMWQVRLLAEAGGTMPPRSTLFLPALPAGLVMRELGLSAEG